MDEELHACVASSHMEEITHCKLALKNSGWEILSNCGWEPFEPGVSFGDKDFEFEHGRWRYFVTFTSKDFAVQENLLSRKRRPLRRIPSETRGLKRESPYVAVATRETLSVPSTGWHVRANSGWQSFDPGLEFTSDFQFTRGKFQYRAIFFSDKTGVQENLQTRSQRALRRWQVAMTFSGDDLACISEALKGIGQLVTKELPGWLGTDAERIDVKERSGKGGSQTYRVSVRGGTLAPVAVHVRNGDVVREPLSERRLACAAEAFSSANASPRRLAQGEDWFVEPWAGESIGWPGEPGNETDPARLGQLLAKIHKIPPCWFDDFKEQLTLLNPTLLEARTGSTLWWASCRVQEYLGDIDATNLSKLLAMEPVPTTRPAAQLVTCHGDFHCNNIVYSEGEGLKAIDLEYAHVNFAAFDLAYCFKTCLRTAAHRWDFVQAYLEVMGESTDPWMVEAVIFDVECYKGLVFYGRGSWQLTLARACVNDWELECLQRFKLAAVDLAASPELRAEAIQLGFEHCGPISRLRQDVSEAKRLWHTAKRRRV